MLRQELLRLVTEEAGFSLVPPEVVRRAYNLPQEEKPDVDEDSKTSNHGSFSGVGDSL